MINKKWKYYTSIDNVFWTNDSIDRPSVDYIEKMNWEEVEIDLHHLSPYTCGVQSKSDKFNIIKAVNVETNKELYWLLKNINMYTEDSYNLVYELDFWSTYNLKMFDKDINVLVDRHQDYDDENNLNFNDESLDSIDLNFKDIDVKKVDFKKDTTTNVKFENNKCYLAYDNLANSVNSCFCLVINDNNYNDYSAFTYVPILSFNSKIVINDDSSIMSVEKEISYSHDETKDDRLSKNIYHFYDMPRFPNIKKWFYDQKASNNSIDVSLQLSLDKNIINVSLNDFFKNYEFDHLWFNTSANLVKSSGTKTYQVLGYNTDGFLYNTKLNQINAVTKAVNHPIFPFSSKMIFKSSSKTEIKLSSVNNSWIEINNLIKSQNFANKINGIYIIPNVLNLTDLWEIKNINNKDFLTLKINQQGNKITTPIKLLTDLKINNKLEFNSPIPLNKIIYRYFQCEWLNNKIDLSMHLKNNDVLIDGTINFTNTFNIISNNKKYLLENRVFSLPAQQPLKSDTYNKYVQANMNSVNTGYAISKQQSMISGIQGLFSSITSGLIGGALSGNPLGMLGGLAGGVSSVGGSILNVKNYEKQMKAKFADANNTHGNELMFSATRDNLWSHLLTSNDQFEAVMIKELTDDSIIQLNNKLLLNGVYNPKYFKLNDLPKTTQHLGFYYAKLNTTNFNQVFSKYINETKEVKEIILKNFEEFRVWDKIPSIE